MTQVYFDPARESMLHSLPDCEVFYVDKNQVIEQFGDTDETEEAVGWYWQACFSGCLPDSEPCGPFDTEQAAILDAQEPYTFE